MPLSDAELREIKVEWSVFDDTNDVAAVQVHRLLDEIERLADELDHWRKRALFAEQFIPKESA